MEIRKVEFQFKGSRDYIQGPDIFNVMTEIGYSINSLNNIRFTVHDFVHKPICKLYLADTKELLNDVADIRARCQFEINSVTHWLALTQEGGDAVSGRRYEYDEDRIIKLCSMKDEEIVLLQQSPFTFIESVVSMNKHMHQRLFPDVTGKCLFTRIDLETGCDKREKLSLRFRHNMNYRLTKSDILVSGEKVGDIYFSLVKS